jgi:hypothetical protein
MNYIIFLYAPCGPYNLLCGHALFMLPEPFLTSLVLTRPIRAVRPSVMTDYLASYYDVDRQKVGERIVTSDEQRAYLFHVVQEYVR